MHIGSWYVSRGRIDRRTFWLHYFLPIAVAGIVASILDLALGLNFSGTTYWNSNGPIGIAVSLATLVPSFSSGVTRLHDRGHSAWWMLFSLIPLAGFIVLLVQFCLPGDGGPNRYGPAPAPRGVVPDPPYPATWG